MIRLVKAMLPAFLAVLSTVAPAVAAEIAVGVAKVDVTPTHPVVLAGYGNRIEEFEGTYSPLWVRAIAIGDENPVVVAAVDNCGFPAAVTDAVRRKIAAEGVFDASRLVVSATHTHSAPSLVEYAPILWEGRDTEAQRERAKQYTDWLVDKIAEAATAAVRDRKPADLSWGQGRVRFGGNRRAMKDGVWVGFGFAEKAPVDHSLPVMVARRDGQVVAVWTNYACHCTTAGTLNHIGGDWAGFAATEIERSIPGASAVVTVGCGADVGPQPTGSVDLARRHGRALADEVAKLAATELTPLSGDAEVRHRVVDLPLAPAPDREHWVETAKRDDFDGRHAKRMLAQLDRDGALPKAVPLPVTVWRFGSDLAIVFLGGEVTVDYAVRLKRELDWTRLWINAYSDDVPCYVPSKRVLDEGGYEADFSMIYYAWPSRFDPAVEDTLVSNVEELVGGEFKPQGRIPEPDFLAVPESALPSMRQ